MGETNTSTRFQNHRVEGCVAAPFTPFKDDGEVNFDGFEKYVDYLVDNNFQHAFVNGTLAEGMSMTIEERKKTAEKWVKSSKGKLKIILHVGTNNLRDSQELARHAQEIGVDAVAALCPSFYKPKNEEILVEYISGIANKAPALPFYYYAINFVTGVYLDDAKILRLAKDKIPNLCGLKHSSPELPNAFRCMAVDKRFQVLMGTDVQFLPCLSLGIDVPVTAPYMGKLYKKLKSAYDDANESEAKRLQRMVQDVNEIRSKYGGDITAAKCIFRIVSGVDVGPVRLPLSNLSQADMENLRKDIENSKLFM